MAIRLEGRGIHGGARCAVVFSREPGPTTLGRGEDRAPIAALVASGIERTTSATLPSGASVRSIEHLLAAIAGANAFAGLRVEIEGDEAPLLDGCAATFFDAIATIERGGAVEPLRVARVATLEAHGTTMHLAPHDATAIEVVVDFDAARFGRALRGSARWDGAPASFRASIATARTFGAARELEVLRARGLAAHVPEGVVVALDLDDPARMPRDEGEPIRHKLLDAIGDLATLGAPIVGAVRLERPSHRGTTALVSRARAEGLFG